MFEVPQVPEVPTPHSDLRALQNLPRMVGGTEFLVMLQVILSLPLVLGFGAMNQVCLDLNNPYVNLTALKYALCSFTDH